MIYLKRRTGKDHPGFYNKEKDSNDSWTLQAWENLSSDRKRWALYRCPRSTALKRFFFQYARDYTYRIFIRYQRRFGWLSLGKAQHHLEKVMDRLDWHSRAYVHVPQYYHLDFMQIDGPFSPVGPVMRWGFPEKEPCTWCGDPLIIIKGYIFDKKKSSREDLPDAWLAGHFPHGGLECSNPLCNDARKYFLGTLELIEKAKRIGIGANRPIRQVKLLLPDEPRGTIIIAAFLDFEARYYQRVNSLAKTRTGDNS